MVHPLAAVYGYTLALIIAYLIYEVVKDGHKRDKMNKCKCGTAISFWDVPNCENCGRTLPEYKWTEDKKLEEKTKWKKNKK